MFIRFNGDDKELSLEERDDRFPYPHVEKFAIQLISPVTWEVSNTRLLKRKLILPFVWF